MMYWACCHTDVGAERRARDGIEALDRGTLLPTFAKVYYSGGLERAFETPVLNRYVLVALHGKHDPVWSQINALDGVDRVLCNGDEPSRVTEKEVERLMWTHMTGALNNVQHRASNGRFVKPRRRRARPRAGKKARNLTYMKGANPHAIQSAS